MYKLDLSNNIKTTPFSRAAPNASDGWTAIDDPRYGSPLGILSIHRSQWQKAGVSEAREQVLSKTLQYQTSGLGRFYQGLFLVGESAGTTAPISR